MCYAKLGLLYHENRRVTIPIVRRLKNPAISKWRPYQKRLMEDGEFERIALEHSSCGIAIVCGQINNIIAIDLDSELSKNIAHKLLPKTPYIKIGENGETRFYSWTPMIKAHKLHHLKIEVLSDGNYTIIPDSIHKNTGKPYIWVDKPLYESDFDEDLPVLLPSIYGAFVKEVEKHTAVNQVTTSEDGRNTVLKLRCSSMIFSNEKPEYIVNELITDDEKLHALHSNGPLFKDHKESKMIYGSAEMNAFMFYLRILESIQSSKPTVYQPFRLEEFEDIPDEPVPTLPLPHEGNSIRQIYDYILGNSYRKQPVLALGASLVLHSVLACNKLCYGTIWPNIMVINSAESGFGKGEPQKAIKRILHACGLSDLVGPKSFSCCSAFAKPLNKQNVILYAIDEASGFFGMATKGTEVYQKEILEFVNDIWSCSDDRYEGKQYAGNDLPTGACWHPCIILLTSTTPQGLASTLTRDSMEKGFIPRFLPLRSFERARHILPANPPILNQGFLERAKLIYGIDTGRGENIRPFNIRNASLDQKYLDEFEDNLFSKPDNDLFLPVYARNFEYMCKLATCYTLGEYLGGHTNTAINYLRATDEALKWARDMMFYINFGLNQTLGESLDNDFANRVRRALTRRSKRGMLLVTLKDKTAPKMSYQNFARELDAMSKQKLIKIDITSKGQQKAFLEKDAWKD